SPLYSCCHCNFSYLYWQGDCVGSSRIKIPQFSERCVVLVPLLSRAADDDVVKDFNLEQLAGADEIAGDFDVGFAGSGVAAGMVVDEHDGGGVGCDGGFEHLARMHENGVECALGDFFDADESAASVEEHDGKAFDFVGAVLLTEHVGDALGVIEGG